MLYTALRYQGPSAIRYPRGKAMGVSLTADYQEIPWGKAELLTEGKDFLILAVGSMVYPALITREILGEKRFFQYSCKCTFC